ncbi:MAG: hypothetical protein M1817_000051 [Caeruleum heppii]|nr:MAG: hypothetical protein M1817_000051 [Caeruleum heppii]
MAPIRRYLRITKYSVLECRIYLDNPSLVSSWLLNPRDPILPRIIDAVRPLVLPKLREEIQRSKGKSKKANKGIKDVVIQDDFEVSIYLKDVSTRHSILTRQKLFHEPIERFTSNSTRLTQGTNDQPIEVTDEVAPAILREDSDEDAAVALQDVPTASEMPLADPSDQERLGQSRASDRRRQRQRQPTTSSVASGLDEEDAQPRQSGSFRRTDQVAVTTKDYVDDKKKLAFITTYDGFSIYGRILYLVIKRRTTAKGKSTEGTGQAMMEDWIISTQVGTADDAED